MLPSIRSRGATVFLGGFLVLASLGFRLDAFGVAAPEQFDRFAEGMESAVVGRVARSEQSGLFSEAGLLLWDSTRFSDRARFEEQTPVYLESRPIESVIVYRSHPGAQGFVFGLVDAVSPWSNETNLAGFRWLAALVSAICLTAFVGYLLRTLGWAPALGAAFGLLASPWLVVSGGHLYWISGVHFLPLIAVAVVLARVGPVGSAWVVVAGTCAGVLAKALVGGFELATASVSMAMVPVAVLAIRDGWDWRVAGHRVVHVTSGVAAGFLMAAALLAVQVSTLHEPGRSGVDHLVDRLMVRTIGESPLGLTTDRIDTSRDRSLADLFRLYREIELVRLPSLAAPGQGRGLSTGWLVVLGLILACASVDAAAIRPLAGGFLVGLVGPVSWLVLFRSHAYLHPFLDPIVWYLPTVPIVGALAGAWVAWSMGRLGAGRQPLA